MATKSETMNGNNAQAVENNAANAGNQQTPPPAQTEVKEGWLKRTKNKISGWCSKHPGWTAFGGAAAGSAATVAAGYGGKKLMERHAAKKQQSAYIQSSEDDSLNPNV